MARKTKNDPAKILGKPLNLANILDYQPAAIVSRTLLDNDAGSITIFAFDRAQGLSEHTAPYDATVQIIEGAAEIKISGKPSRLKAGELIIMPANKPHALRALEKFKMLLIMLRS